MTLHCDVAFLDDEVLREALVGGIPVLCYTVNDPSIAAALYRRGVAAVFSDRIEFLVDD